MALKVLLDANAYSAFRRGEPRVIEIVREAEAIVFSAIVAGELLSGFRQGKRFDENRRQLDDFLRDPRVTMADVTITTADRFGRVVAALRAKGRPIPTNDMWIAAQALETAADLVSYDHHFGAVDGLAWVDPGA